MSEKGYLYFYSAEAIGLDEPIASSGAFYSAVPLNHPHLIANALKEISSGVARNWGARPENVRIGSLTFLHKVEDANHTRCDICHPRGELSYNLCDEHEKSFRRWIAEKAQPDG